MSKKSFACFAIILLVGTVFFSSFVAGQVTRSFGGISSSYSFARYQQRPSYRSYYTSSQIDTYWPVLNDADNCEARSDIMLQVAPAGCQPTVVRSDLLAEQNVPVFCQVDAWKINPLVDIDQIRNIRFIGEYPPEVAGVGFHPARAALRTHDTLLGSPLVNNIGYVVVVLKQQPDESKLPDFVNVTLNAQIDYDIGNAYGIGRSEFILEPVSDKDWETEKLKNSFWNGRYFVRLEEVDSNFARVSIYDGDRRVGSYRVEKGKTSPVIYVPGLYCRAGLQIRYDGFVSAETKARIEVSSGSGVDSFDVYKGSSFLDGRCRVGRIDVDDNKETGKVEINCRGKRVVLELKPRANEMFTAFEGKVPEQKNEDYEIDLRDLKDEKRRGLYILDKENNLLGLKDKQFVLVKSDGSFEEKNVEGKDKDWLLELYNALKEYKDRKEADPGYEIGSFVNKNIAKDTREWFEGAIADFEMVADDYPSEKEYDVEAAKKYGEIALEEGIELARKMGMDSTQARLINKYLEIYPDGGMASTFVERLNGLYKIDNSLAGEVIEFDDKARTMRLVSLSEPRDKASAVFYVDGKRTVIEKGEKEKFMKGTSEVAEVTLDSVDVEDARITAKCLEGNLKDKTKRYSFRKDGKTTEVCELVDVVLTDTNSNKLAKIQLLPSARSSGPEGEGNFTVHIGIEKRAIKLNPDKTMDRIEEINKTIKKWEDISEKLGKIVTGLKGACFATATLLTFKNFFSGLSGEAIARQMVMQGDNGWNARCKEMVANGEKGYASLDACYLGESDKIDSDVNAYMNALNKINPKIQAIQSKYKTSDGLFGESVDTDKARAAIAEEARRLYSDVEIDMDRYEWLNENGERLDKIKISEILSEENIENDLVSTGDLRDIMLYAELQRSSDLSDEQKENLKSRFAEAAERVNQNMIIQREFEKEKDLKSAGFASPIFAGGEGQRDRVGDVVTLMPEIRSSLGFDESRGATHTTTIIVPAREAKGKDGEVIEKYEGGTYIVSLKQSDIKQGVYTVDEIVNKNTKKKVERVGAFLETYGIGNIRASDRVSYHNEIVSSDRVCRYYETEPYKGMPAVIPFDYKRGWYAATRQQLPAFGGIGAFDASGRVTSFWLCNVGENGRIQFESGLGDDLCQMINLNTGQPIEMFPGLSESEARSLVIRATRAIEEAARQYGNKYITVGGERCEVGEPAVGVSGTSCQDFMSPKDCHLLFNVCDPVICPASRCDFGGTYRVADVIQTGIVGSVFLCLPNVREGIAMPVCLTGIQAGVDGLVSIMKNYRDCLQENLETGRMVGICDQIYSIYLCEFLWRQVAPFLNVLIPKLIEVAYGQGVRGGVEYLTVMSSWQNAQKSVQQFTQNYAVNSMEAFQARSIEEAGTPICKAFISAKAPTAFETLVEPDSPPQFHAWFDSTTYSSATVPATAHYKVFYHIYAGKDQGVYFSVYLKNPPQGGYYTTAERVMVDSGYVERGGYASETRDFTAPEGYKELCVRINDDERCGFKQVSTSFAVNYLRDAWVNEELRNKDITSEEECISGNPSLGAMATPNVMGGVGEVVSPQIYNRGVVRICSTENPGKTTNPARFKDVGYCGDTKIRCWLDVNSVDNALTDSNIGMKNATLSELEEMTDEQLLQQGFMLSDEALAEIYSIESAVLRLDGSESIVSDAQAILDRIEEVWDMLWFNNHKAKLILLRGQVKEKVALSLFRKEPKPNVKDVSSEESKGIVEEGKSVAGEVGEEKQSEVVVADKTVKEVVSEKTGIMEPDMLAELTNSIIDYNRDNLPEGTTADSVLPDGAKIEFPEEASRINDLEIVDGNVSEEDREEFERILSDIEAETLREEEDGLSISANCNACGDGIFNICDYEECLGLGENSCYFVDGTFSNGCYSCEDIKGCVDYPEKGSCEQDMCGLGCNWDDVLEECSIGSHGVAAEDYYGVKDSSGVKIITFGDKELRIAISGNKVEANGCWVGTVVSTGRINIVPSKIDECNILDEELGHLKIDSELREHLEKINGNFVKGIEIVDVNGERVF